MLASLILSAALAATPQAIAPPATPHAGQGAVGVVDHPCQSEPSMKQAGGWGPWHTWLYAHDYGQLCYYRAQNAKLGSPSPAHPRVVFMGDSITEVWKQRDPGFFTDGRIDRGISGQTTPQMLVRFRQDVIDLHPAAVHIMAGTNDIAGNTGASTLQTVEGHIASMAELAHAHGIAVILASVPPTTHFGWQPKVKPAPVIARLNRWIAAYAARHHYVYVDYHRAMSTPSGAMKPGYAADGVHPTAKGFSVMDPLTLKAIAKALHSR
ncbi:GDSL-type esterase/lipase family protein [Oleiagrimonas sp. C23AA]|uniref:GDSL-type esterase/lipase family protein n=1 Tax=Oleiagrimonas sp. C23AA TaxID=2719047 RepID=UPI001423A159|nr:GDSL-type esterase/lipase family protein [Oleiagrimonas sp. C23AA]NII09139.1 GDSL family lipase [Oleiagrimonas sp. C23AA]